MDRVRDAGREGHEIGVFRGFHGEEPDGRRQNAGLRHVLITGAYVDSNALGHVPVTGEERAVPGRVFNELAAVTGAPEIGRPQCQSQWMSKHAGREYVDHRVELVILPVRADHPRECLILSGGQPEFLGGLVEELDTLVGEDGERTCIGIEPVVLVVRNAGGDGSQRIVADQPVEAGQEDVGLMIALLGLKELANVVHVPGDGTRRGRPRTGIGRVGDSVGRVDRRDRVPDVLKTAGTDDSIGVHQRNPIVEMVDRAHRAESRRKEGVAQAGRGVQVAAGELGWRADLPDILGLVLQS